MRFLRTDNAALTFLAKNAPRQLLAEIVALLKSVNASAAVNQLLTAGIEGMALGADFNLELALNGTALEGLTACAANDAFAVGRMDVLFHFSFS